MPRSSSKKLVAVLFASLVCLVPIMEAAVLAPNSSLGALLGPGLSPDFTITSSPTSLTLSSGSSGTTLISLQSIGGFAGTILLSTAPSPLDASLDKQNVTLTSGSTGTASLTVIVPTGTSPNNYTITVTGIAGCATLHTRDIKVTVTGPEFSISTSKPSLSTLPGGYNSTIITITSKNGFSGLVDLFAFASGGVSTSLSPAPVPLSSGGTVSSNLTIFVPLSTLPGNYTLEVDASSGPLVQFLGIIVTVKGPGFTASANPLFLMVLAGGSNSSTITLKPFGGFSGVVSLLNASFPSGLEAVFTPSTLTLPGSTTSTLTVSAPIGLTPGYYDLVVTAFSSSYNATVALPVLLKGPDFTVSTSPSEVSVKAGGSSCTSTLTVTAVSGFTGPITLVNSTFPTGLNVSISTKTIITAGTATISVSAPANAVPGPHYVLISANSSSTSHFTSVTVDVTGPDFKLSTSPTSLTVTAPSTGTQNVTFTVTVGSLNGFTGIVTLAAFLGGLNMTATVNPVNVTASGPSTLTVGVGSMAQSGVYTVYIVGASGALSHTTTVDVTVIAPDFSINANPGVITFDTTTTTTSTISISALNSFTGTVNLSAFTSAGLNASITPSSVMTSGTATLNLNSTVPGTYIVEIDGNSGLLTHFAFVSVTVTGPDFSIVATPSTLTIPAGWNASSTITVAPLNGFSGNVNLTTFTPFGLFASFNVSTISPSQSAKLKILVAPGTPAGTYLVDIQGTSGPLTHTKILTVKVSDFTLTASPTSLTIAKGTSQDSIITVGSLNGFSGTVTLSASAPTGLSTITNSSSVTGSGHVRLTVSAGSSTVPGTYTLNVTAVYGALNHTTVLVVTVPTPDFTLSGPLSLNVLTGVTGNATITITSIAGFTDTVSLSYNSSAGLICSLTPSSVTGGAGTSVLGCSGSVGTYTVTVNGTSTSAGPRTTVLTYTITDFTISAGAVSPSQKGPGVSGTSTITLTGVNGFAGTVGLSVSTSTPPGLTCYIPPTAVFGSSPQTKTLSCSASATGDYTVSVTGSVGSVTRTTASILVHVADFPISANPATVTALAGASADSTVTVAPQNGFTGTLSLSFSSAPSGLTCTLAPLSIVLGTTQTSTLSCSGSAGAYSVTVTGTVGSLVHATIVSYTEEDFSLTASPTSASVSTGSAATSTITVSFLNGFTGTISLTESSSPSTSIACNLTSSSFTNSGTTTLSCTPSVTGTFTITVTGIGYSLSHTATFAVTSSTPNFTVSANPTTLTIQAGRSGTATITIAPVNGFTGTVTLTPLVTNAGLTPALNVTSIMGGSGMSTLTITVGSNTVPATYTVTVQGVSGNIAHNTMVNVTVTAPGSNVLGLPSTTLYGIIILLVIAAVGVAVYFTRFRKKTPAMKPATRPASKKS